jgi:hypothetical protein
MKNLRSENIHFFRSERGGQFYNPRKVYVGVVDNISMRDVNILPFVGVIDDNGNKMDVTAKEIHDFENGKSERLVFEWDTCYDTSYYVRESGLLESEIEMIERSC